MSKSRAKIQIQKLEKAIVKKNTTPKSNKIIEQPQAVKNADEPIIPEHKTDQSINQNIQNIEDVSESTGDPTQNIETQTAQSTQMQTEEISDIPSATVEIEKIPDINEISPLNEPPIIRDYASAIRPHPVDSEKIKTVRLHKQNIGESTLSMNNDEGIKNTLSESDIKTNEQAATIGEDATLGAAPPNIDEPIINQQQFSEASDPGSNSGGGSVFANEDAVVNTFESLVVMFNQMGAPAIGNFVKYKVPIRLSEFVPDAAILMDGKNQKIVEIIQITKEEKDAIKPVAVRVMRKHGAVISDEAQLGGMLAGLALNKTISIVQLRAELKQFESELLSRLDNLAAQAQESGAIRPEKNQEEEQNKQTEDK